ncbi:hypothetical protein JXB41_04515 [Candidatus Woesearchaeota archaeon]|nr:hypothetical protein [Candidatus Woesearchaeota archaeon]
MKEISLFNIEENFEYLRKGSLVGLVIVVIILFSSYYDLFKLIKVNINNIFILLCWVYLIINIALANGLKYMNDKELPICPKCNKKLEVDGYKCSKCGTLRFER